MVMLNDLDRYHLVMDVIDRVPELWASRPPGCARRWPTRGCARGRTRVRSATTCPRSATGRGRAPSRPRPAPPRPPADPTRWRSSPSTPAPAASSCASSAKTTRSSPRRSWPRRRPRWIATRSSRALAGSARRRRGGRSPHRPRRRPVRVARRSSTTRSAVAWSELTDLAPLHQPKSLAALDAVSEQLPGVPAVACFDTAFHATLPPAASTYALPAALARALGAAPLRLPRAVARLGGPPRRAVARRAATACRGSCPVTWGPARPCAPSPPGARWTPRWVSRRSRAWSWQRDRGASIPDCCCGCSSARRSTSAGWPTRSSTSPGWRA